MRLSRTSLNILIVVCVALVTWGKLSAPPSATLPDEPIAVLANLSWQPLGGEDLSIWFMEAPQAEARVAIKTATELHHLSLANPDWTTTINAQLPQWPSAQPMVILLQGPWPENERHTLLAWLAFRLQPEAVPAQTIWPLCVQTHLAAAAWLAQQQQKPWPVLHQVTLPSSVVITAEEWLTWRTLTSLNMVEQWHSYLGQIDIQADIAYHRLPQSSYAKLYQAIAQSQPDEVSHFIDCVASTGDSAQHE